MRKPDAALAAELAGAQAFLAARHDVLAALERGDFGNPGGFSDYLRAFSRQAVPGLWLTGFDVSGGGAEMAISGRAVAADLLPQYIRRLNGETVFRGRNFAALKMNGGEDKPAIPQDGTGRPPPEAAAAPHFVEFNLASANVKSATEEGMR
ncbi:MAG: PilN domain-containing protein [Chromatiales bacterium]|nr:PilN domain-containing protein [Chromatiales bacterium]